jgi:rhamnulokinase/L-fuculokinase
MAKEAKPFKCFIDPDAPEFTPAGNIPKRINEYCARTAQPVPETDGEVMRCIYESLALKYRAAKEELEICTGRKYAAIYMVGGGTKDRFLSQLTACACDCTVSSGPIEATALGNIAIQLMAHGEISGLAQAREIVRNSEKIYTFEPQNTDEWSKAYEKYKEVNANA